MYAFVEKEISTGEALISRTSIRPQSQCLARSSLHRAYQADSYGKYIFHTIPREFPSKTRLLNRKIPYRLSAHQKARQRKRLRRVDNVVSVLDTALQRQQQATSFSRAATHTQDTPGDLQPRFKSTSDEEAASSSQIPSQSDASSSTTISKSDLTSTAEGQRTLTAAETADLESRRHGRGPKQGDMLPTTTSLGVPKPHPTRTLIDEARATSTIKLIARWKAEMPTEAEMLARDKYTMFDKKEKKFRKGIHKLPKWTRVSQRLNPPGF